MDKYLQAAANYETGGDIFNAVCFFVAGRRFDKAAALAVNYARCTCLSQ